MKKLTTTAALLVIVMCSANVSAQQSLTTDKRAVIRELIVVLDVGANANKVISTYVDEISKQYPKIVESIIDGDPDLTPTQRKLIKETLNETIPRFTERMLELIKQRMDVAKVVEEITYSLYDKYFTEAEIKDLIEFHKTPTGKKSLSIMPQLLAESMQQSNERLSPALTEIMLKILEEERARIKTR